MTITTSSCQILLALLAQPRHGLAILDAIEDRTGTTVPIGTLYRSLKALHDAGHIEPVQPREGEDPRRRTYRITRRGRAAVRLEAEQASKVVAWAMTEHLLGRPLP